ncbi:hypothetical protein THRCLA_07847 [Thraustotheca clavata]|uniref:Uncharacterized protein n=1 Tax=Thraustotheca clavata TaxID=74557 RepID=A0A1V9ZBZ9_9STRA|nr:hypothetical protein THRCLA_07847 [Thraustotheca clavata]
MQAREEACKLLAQSLNEPQSYDDWKETHGNVCQCWSVLLQGIPTMTVELPGKSAKKCLYDQKMWLHAMTLTLCFSNAHEFTRQVPSVSLANIKSVQAGRISPGKNSTSTAFAALTTHEQHQVYQISFASCHIRNQVVAMLGEIVKVIDVMARIQDQVHLHLTHQDSIEDNQIPKWTAEDLQSWLHTRQLSSLFVPLHTYLDNLHAYENGDAYDMLLYLTDETIRNIISNENNQECTAVLSLRHLLMDHLQKARQESSSRLKKKRFWTKLF